MIAALEWEFISIDDPRIAEEKCKIYKALRERIENGGGSLEKIPYIKITAMGVETKRENENVIRFVNQIPEDQPVPLLEKTTNPWTAFSMKNLPKLFFQEKDGNRESQTVDSGVFDLIQGAVVDDENNYAISLYLGKPSLAKIYRLQREHDTKEKNTMKNFITPCIKEWLKIKTNDDIQALLQKLVDPDGNEELEFHLQNWTYHVKEMLFKNPSSRLYPLRNESADGFLLDNVEFLLVDLDASVKKWSDLLIQYRKDNPGPLKYDDLSPHLQSRPYDYHLLERGYISFIAYDRVDERMIGYSTFSLTDLNFLIDGKMPFRTKELSQLHEIGATEHVNGKDENTLGYVLYHLDGLHVHKDEKYRSVLSNGMSIAKILVFCGMEYIRHSYKLLGVKMVVASVFSSAMKQILVGTFGFSHYNRHNDAIWMRNILDDFSKILDTSSSDPLPEVPTPRKYLTLSHIRTVLNGFIMKYYAHINISISIKDRHTLMAVLEDLDDLISQYPNQMSAHDGRGRESRQFRVYFQRVRKPLIDFQERLHLEWNKAEKDTSEERDIEYMKDLRVYLEVEEDDDTFLFLGSEDGPPQTFLQALDNFPLVRKKEVLVISDEEDEGEVLNPTEDEMALYLKALELLEGSVNEKEIMMEPQTEPETERRRRLEDEIRSLKEKEAEYVERIKQLYEDRDSVEKRMVELVSYRDRIESEIVENEESRKQIALTLEILGHSEKMEEEEMEITEMKRLFIQNFMEKYNIREEAVAQGTIERVLTNVGSSLEGRNSLQKIVGMIKTRFPLLLSYEKFSSNVV